MKFKLFVFIASLFLLAGTSYQPHMDSIKIVPGPFGAYNLCTKYEWACYSESNEMTRGEIYSIANNINKHVNDNANYVVEQGENWSLPYNNTGDCEDFALLKLKKLIDAGVPSNKLFIATAIRPNWQNHAVLILRLEQDYVLDIFNNKVTPWYNTDLTFVFMQQDNKEEWGLILLGPKAKR